jgi:hypothetical protein
MRTSDGIAFISVTAAGEERKTTNAKSIGAGIERYTW